MIESLKFTQLLKEPIKKIVRGHNLLKSKTDSIDIKKYIHLKTNNKLIQNINLVSSQQLNFRLCRNCIKFLYNLNKILKTDINIYL